MTTRTIDLLRFSDGKESTLGVLSLDDGFTCFTCEDAHRPEKVAGRTRIPAGEYEIKFRHADSPMNRRYEARFGKMHRGMLWLQDVPNYTYVYIHIGNTDDDTEGCVLVGYGADVDRKLGGGTIRNSTVAYSRLYDIVAGWLLAGDTVKIVIRDGQGPDDA